MVRMGLPLRRSGGKAAAIAAAEDQEGKASRFKALALPHLDDVYTLARYLVPRAAAEDAVQECYLRAFRYFDSFGGSAIKPWLFAILRNVCLSQRAKNGSLVFGERENIGEAADEMPPLWGDPPETPENALIRREEAMTLRKLIAGLPAEFREVLVLRELHDLSYREIAAIVDAPAGTVMSRLARARGMLRDALAAKEAGA
jgi:RNA polymerase sigma factor (sigma-70 family)